MELDRETPKEVTSLIATSRTPDLSYVVEIVVARLYTALLCIIVKAEFTVELNPKIVNAQTRSTMSFDTKARNIRFAR